MQSITEQKAAKTKYTRQFFSAMSSIRSTFIPYSSFSSISHQSSIVISRLITQTTHKPSQNIHSMTKVKAIAVLVM